MSDADLKANISVSTDVEQATKKTGNAVVSLSKQFEDIQKKFSTAAKDIFLGLFAPMAIFQTVSGFITDAIAKAKQDAQDGLDLIAKGETVYATSEEKKTAAFFKAKAEREKEIKSVAAGKEQLGREFSMTEEGRKAMNDFLNMGTNRTLVQTGQGGVVNYEGVYKNKAFQDFMIKRFLETPEGKAYQPIFGDKKDFKGPENFSNVVGVGANPVLETMTRQTQIQEEILEHLKTTMPTSGQTDIDFTKLNPSITTTA